MNHSEIHRERAFAVRNAPLATNVLNFATHHVFGAGRAERQPGRLPSPSQEILNAFA